MFFLIRRAEFHGAACTVAAQRQTILAAPQRSGSREIHDNSIFWKICRLILYVCNKFNFSTTYFLRFYGFSSLNFVLFVVGKQRPGQLSFNLQENKRTMRLILVAQGSLLTNSTTGTIDVTPNSLQIQQSIHFRYK